MKKCGVNWDKVKQVNKSCLSVAITPYVKFKKYFEMRQLSDNTFQSFNMEVYEKLFFSFLSGQGKLFILQHVWSYIIISISKEIRNYIETFLYFYLYKKWGFSTFYQRTV